MSDKRIIDLPTLQTALGNDAWLVVDVESGATYKIKKSALLGLQSLETQSQEVYGAINEVRSLAEDLVSDEYDATSAYAKGDYCIYNNTLYKCTTAIGSGGEAWNASHWSATKCDDELSELKQSLDDCFQSDDSTVVGLATDTTILSFGAGSYKIALPSASEYIPIRYGVLNVFVARDYVFCLVLDSANNMYKRFGNNSTLSWYTNWTVA